MVSLRRNRRCVWLPVAASCAAAVAVWCNTADAWEDDKHESLLTSLDGATRAKVFAALGGLVLLGMAMLFFVWWGGRFARRYMHSSKFDRPQPKTTPHNLDDWADKPLIDGGEDDDSPQGR